MSIPRKMFSSFQKPLNNVTSRGHQQGAQVVMRGAADRPLAVAAVSIAAAASLAWLSRRRHRRRLAFTEAHVLAAMLRSGAISSAALSAGINLVLGPRWGPGPGSDTDHTSGGGCPEGLVEREEEKLPMREKLPPLTGCQLYGGCLRPGSCA